MATGAAHRVTLLVREGCGSCVRVHHTLVGLCAEAGAELEVLDVDAAGTDPGMRVEFGDRLPVVLLDGAEHSCWEIDEDELRAELAG